MGGEGKRKGGRRRRKRKRETKFGGQGSGVDLGKIGVILIKNI